MLTDADVRYVLEEFVPLDDVCAAAGRDPAEVRRAIAERRLPAPAYVLSEGTEMLPADYFDLPAPEDWPVELGEDREAYLDGTYFVCLRRPTPENVVRKNELVVRLRAALADPRPDDEGWQRRVRVDVDELDALERPFSPDFDRGPRFDRPPTRDELIATAHRLYPRLWAAG